MRRPTPAKEAPARRRAKPGRRPKPVGEKTRKLNVSFAGKLADQVEEAANREMGGNVSAWLAQAAERSLKSTILDELFDDMIREKGPPSPEAVAQIERQWRGE